MMINKIELINFESHKYTVLDISKGVNAIIGESEHGKSAILRAIYWVSFNRPSGDEFKSKWGGDTKVTLSLDEYQIVREKSKKENCYKIINNTNKKEKKLSGFGQSVPKEVVDILKITSLNFQTQFEPHFLLPPVSPGEVARKLNEILDLEVIDKTQYNINIALKDTKKSISQIDLAIDMLQAEKKEFAWIRNANMDLETLEKHEKQLNDYKNKEQRLTKIIWEIKDVQKKIKELECINNAEVAFKDVLLLSDDREKCKEDQKKLSKTLSNITEIDNAILKTKEKLNSLEKEYKRKMPRICPLCEQEIKQ